MPDPYETFVRWYLRFNGYLAIENFVIHEPSAAGVAQGGESDVIAVRFPYSREEPSFPLRLDERLLSKQAADDRLIDFVIAEVKSGNKKSLNKVWSPPDQDGTKSDRIAYLVRWLGCFEDDATIRTVAQELQTKHQSVRKPYLIRLIYFAREETQQAVPDEVLQVTFKNIADFFVTVRTPCWQDNGLGVRSAHEQWDPLIKLVWKIGLFDALDQDSRAQLILAMLDSHRQ
jgi:hypothetical protein